LGTKSGNNAQGSKVLMLPSHASRKKLIRANLPIIYVTHK